MKTIKSIFNWIKPRWLRLAIGVLLLSIAFDLEDNMIGFFGAILLIQGVTGQSCFGGSCAIPIQQAPSDK